MKFDVGIQARINFDNGYGASVIKSPHSYGGNQDLYELAIIKDNAICYDTLITDDVLGYLTEDDVTKYLKQIQNLHHHLSQQRFHLLDSSL